MKSSEVGKVYETNTSGALEIISLVNGGRYNVKFLVTGYETEASIHNIRNGKVLDPIYKKIKLSTWYDYHEEFVNNSGQKFVAFAKCRKKVKVRFTDSGYETEVYIENAKSGKVSDPYEKSFLGIGYLGEFDRVPYWKQAKQLWSNVMKRCYNPKDYMGYYGRAFVEERWHCFAEFLNDIPTIHNFDKWLEGKNGGPVYNFDKDLKTPGNKTYSKQECMFVSEYDNKSAGAINARALDKVNGRYKESSVVGDTYE